MTSNWLDELDLDPAASPIAMGTRALGDRPWLLIDDARAAELALKADLCATRHDEVVAVDATSREAGAAVVDLVEAAGVTVSGSATLHPLDAAGRCVQEDLCLMQRRVDGWYLAAASLCFPSRWRLADKIGRHVTEVHAPVRGYRSSLATRVDSLFDRLTARPVWRRNWFVHPGPALFQPDRPVGGDPIIPAADVGDELWLRSERQTLRRLPVDDGWILFTIRVQQAPLGALVETPARAAAFATYVTTAPTETLTHRGMAPAQVAEIRAWMAG